MAEILGKVTTRTLDVPRGPDVVHRIRVARSWFHSGAVVEFEVPRNLSCASCDGGGCDLCARAGAITLRARHAAPERISVTLPARDPDESSDPRSVVIRIPERGGLPAEGSALPRGLLLLRVEVALSAGPGVRRIEPSREGLVERANQALRTPRARAKRVRALLPWAFGLALLVLAVLAFLELRR